MHVAEAKKQLGTRIPWICDSMDNAMKHAMGDRPNSEFIVDADGKIVVARDWSSPDELRNDLTELVGAPEHTTTIAELEMKPVEPAHAAPTGVVPRIRIPSGMVPLKVTPLFRSDDEPFYVKLRAEAQQDVLQSGTGKLYLGFMLDPLYHVHWNNDAMPVVFEITDSGGLVIAPGDAEAPAVSVKADADPREFLIDVCSELLRPGSQRELKITLKVKYFACDDAQTFCKPVTQTYVIALERDRDAGNRRSFSANSGRQPGGPGRAPATESPPGRQTADNSGPARPAAGQSAATPEQQERWRQRMERRRQQQLPQQRQGVRRPGN